MTGAAVLLCVRGLTREDLAAWAGSSTASRGREIARDGRVRGFVRHGANAALAWVEGTEPYVTRVEVRGARSRAGRLSSTCTCPIDGPACKHAVAVLATWCDLLARREPIPAVARDDDRLWMLEDEDASDDASEDASGACADAALLAHVECAMDAGLDPDFDDDSDGDSDEAGSSFPDLGPLRDALDALVRAGHTDAVVSVGPDLLRRAGRRVAGTRDDAMAAEEAASCMAVVFRALGKCSLSPEERILYAIGRSLDDHHGLAPHAERFLRRRHARMAWHDVAEALLPRVRAARGTGRGGATGEDHRYRPLAAHAITALRGAGRPGEARALEAALASESPAAARGGHSS